MEALKAISKELQDDTLKEQVVQAMQLKDLVRGSVLLSKLMPQLMGTFQRKWLLSNWHYDCLVKAIDVDDDGMLDWDAFKLAGALVDLSGGLARRDHMRAALAVCAPHLRTLQTPVVSALKVQTMSPCWVWLAAAVRVRVASAMRPCKRWTQSRKATQHAEWHSAASGPQRAPP